MPSSPNYKEVLKTCEVCLEPLVLNNTRDIERKKYCSPSCRGRAAFLNRKSIQKTCETCGIVFITSVSNQKFCSIDCIPSYKQTTEQQYRRLNSDNTPVSYIKQLLARTDRKQLSIEDVLELWSEQEGLCALTGVEMTFKRELGTRFRTNLSIDRIEAGGPYIKSNIRLVCSIVNKMRLDMEDSELRFWCRKIMEA